MIQLPTRDFAVAIRLRNKCCRLRFLAGRDERKALFPLLQEMLENASLFAPCTSLGTGMQHDELSP